MTSASLPQFRCSLQLESMKSPPRAPPRALTEPRALSARPRTDRALTARARAQHLSGYEQYFAMARGTKGAEALDMSKFFDTNYHYLVPELAASVAPNPDFSTFIAKARARRAASRTHAMHGVAAGAAAQCTRQQGCAPSGLSA